MTRQDPNHTTRKFGNDQINRFKPLQTETQDLWSGFNSNPEKQSVFLWYISKTSCLIGQNIFFQCFESGVKISAHLWWRWVSWAMKTMGKLVTWCFVTWKLTDSPKTNGEGIQKMAVWFRWFFSSFRSDLTILTAGTWKSINEKERLNQSFVRR